MEYIKYIKGEEEMVKKTIDKIAKDYEKFNIPKEQIPQYQNPYQFTKTFQRCSAVEYRNISYSNKATAESKSSNNE